MWWLLLVSCSARSAPLALGDELASASEGEVLVRVLRWTRDDDRGRLVVAEVGEVGRVEVKATDTPTALSELASGPGVAVNGGFYHPDGSPMGWVVADSEEIRALTRGGGSGVFAVTGDRARVVHRSAAGELGEVRHAVQSIDRLVSEGRSVVGEGASPALDARSAVGVQADGDVLLAVAFDEEAVGSEVDGVVRLDAASSSTGLSMAEWAEVMRGLGATEALNLDGGLSTSMHVSIADLHLEIVAAGATIGAIAASP